MKIPDLSIKDIEYGTLDDRGSVVIPITIRKKLNLIAGDKIAFYLSGNKISMINVNELLDFEKIKKLVNRETASKF